MLWVAEMGRIVRTLVAAGRPARGSEPISLVEGWRSQPTNLNDVRGQQDAYARTWVSLNLVESISTCIPAPRLSCVIVLVVLLNCDDQLGARFYLMLCNIKF